MSEKKELNLEELEEVTGGKRYDSLNKVEWTHNVNDLIFVTSQSKTFGLVKEHGVVYADGGVYPYNLVKFLDGVHQTGWYADEETEFIQPTDKEVVTVQ